MTTREMIQRTLIRAGILLALVIIACTRTTEFSRYIDLIVTLVILGITLARPKYTFPFITLSSVLFFLATTNVIWDIDLKHAELTKFYWTAGNTSLVFGLGFLLYKLKDLKNGVK